MANRIKSISKYSGTAWGTETPIGADAANVDLATSYTTVTESTATSGATAEAAIGKIHTDTTNLKKAGHGNGTVTNYDSTSSETSKVLTTDCVVAASDDTATAWSKFNRFRRRVSNKFADYFTTANLKTAVSTTGATSTVYTTSAINQYLANVVGYTDATSPEAGTIASQLSTLNDNIWPVGIILHCTSSSFNPNVAIGPTWERIEGKFLLGATDGGASSWNTSTKSASIAPGVTGGENDHVLVESEIPTHYHIQTIGPNISVVGSPTYGEAPRVYGQYATQTAGATELKQTTLPYGGSSSHNNMPPFLSVYIWKRVSLT